MAQCRVEVVAPQHRNGAAADPDAFGAAGWAIKDAGRLSELVHPLALVLAGFGSRGGRLLALLGRLLLGLVLREGRCRSNEQRGAEQRYDNTLTGRAHEKPMGDREGPEPPMQHRNRSSLRHLKTAPVRHWK